MTTISKTAGLVALTISTTLLVALARKGVLTSEETREIFEQALLNLETQQAEETDPEERAIFEAARAVLERHLPR